MGRVEKTVFISYRRANDAYAMLIYQHLTHHGFDVFLDYTGISSGNFERVILENVRARAHFLVVLTPTALERCVEPGDWFRREIEEAIEWRRNIVPLLFQGFSFGTPGIESKLAGKLSALKGYHGLDVPMTYFDPAMERLREKYLNVALDAVPHRASSVAQKAAKEQQAAAAAAPRIEETLLPSPGRLTETVQIPHVRSSGKHMINGQTEFKQLVPIKYAWAWKRYLSACANHWMPQEIQMARDTELWVNPKGLSEEERRLVKGNLGFLVTADLMAANNIVLGIYRHITVPECRQYLLRLAFEEAIHTHAYQYIVECLGLNAGELFNAYYEVGSIRAKNEFLIPLIDTLTNPAFKTGTLEANQALLKGLIVFACLIKGLFFDVASTQILGLGRQGKMTGTAELYQYIRRDVRMHCKFVIDVINTIKLENGSLWTIEFREEIRELFRQGVSLAYRYAEDTMPGGPHGPNAAMFMEYVRFTTNGQAQHIGLDPLVERSSNPFPWLSEKFDFGT